MALISPISPESLNLDSIKSNLKQTLIANGTIKDVDYEGSNISQLIQILSYVEYTINATHALNSNETNLKLSNIRQNIIHEAQSLGYNITRKVSAKMNITLTSSVYPLTIPEWTKFSCGDYTFYNTTDIVFSSNNLTQTIDIIEGTYIDYTIDSNLRYVSPEDVEHIEIGYKNIEDSGIFFRVKKEGDDTYSEYYTKVDTLVNIVDSKHNYFEEYDPETEFVTLWTSFANQGNLIKVNDTVDISLLISSGKSANGILVCKLKTPIQGVSIVVNSPSRGGSDEESNDSIKANAPLFFNTGFRTVSAPDYESFLIKNSLVGKASAWGGETLSPVQLGHVFLSVIPQDTNFRYLTSLEDASLLTYLNQQPMIATARKFKYPNYIEFNIDIKVIGKVSNIEDKKASINTNLTNYFAENHNKFKTYFFESKVIRIVENVFLNNSAASVVVTITPRLRLSKELFTQTFLNNRWDIWIPNSHKKYRLVKGTDVIEMPDNDTDLYSYLINGWTKELTPDEDITISFSGTINSKAVTYPADVYTVTIDGKDYDSRKLNLAGNEIGYFIPDLNILSLIDLTDELAVDEFLDITFSPNINVVSEKATVMKLGTITYS